MVGSISYLVFFTLMGTALFLGFLPRLTIEEKTRAFCDGRHFGAGGRAVFQRGVFSPSMTRASPARATCAAMTARCICFPSSSGWPSLARLCGGASYLSQSRSYQDFVVIQQRIEQGKQQALLAAEQRQERMLQGQVQLAKLQAQERYLALQQSALHAEAVDRGSIVAAEAQKASLGVWQILLSGRCVRRAGSAEP